MPRTRVDAGSVTAETAVALPSLVLVAALCAFVLGVTGAQLRCADLARAAARAAARGEPDSAVGATVAAAAAPGAVTIAFRRTPGRVRVVVSADVTPPFPILRRVLPAVPVSATAVAAVEAAT